MTTADVLLVPGRPLQVDPDLLDGHPVLTKYVEVSPGILLGGIEPDVATPVMALTGFRSPHPRDLTVMYGLVRHDPPGQSWDEDDEMAKVVFLSHLVRAQEMGFEHAARVTIDDRKRVSDVKPAEIPPPYARAYCCSGARRRWLTQAEADTLRMLVSAYNDLRPMLGGTRLGQAISAYSETPFVYHGRPRGQLLTTILEGLVSTMPERAFKQFVVRVPALAHHVGLAECDAEWAETMYKLRSKLAHGAPVLPSVGETERAAGRDAFNDALTGLDELLRRLLRTALLDPVFRSRLEDVDVHWPVPGRGCPRCQASNSSLLPVICPSCGLVWRAEPNQRGTEVH